MPSLVNALIARGAGADSPEYNYLDSRRRAAETVLAEQALKDYPEERNYLRQKRDWEKEDRLHEMELRPMKDELEAIQYLTEISPMISWENYPASRQHLIERNGINPAFLPDPRQLQQEALNAGMIPEDYFERWKLNGLQTLTQQRKNLETQAKLIKAEKEKWSAPKEGLDETGKSIVYQVGEDGQVRILGGVQPQPKRGMKIYDREGNLIVDTGGGDGKTIPAAQLNTMAEFGAYTETMDDIHALMNRLGGTTKGKTGIMEIINKRLDNWELLPDKNRIDLRTLVARLPGLMYAMRGKQLSDKELQVALNMMPQMELGPTAFAIAFKNFSDYLDSILENKEKTFKAGGYKVEGVFPDYSKMADEEILKKLGD